MTIDNITQSLLDKLRVKFQKNAVFKPGFDSNDKANSPRVPTGALQLKAFKTEPLYFGTENSGNQLEEKYFVQAEYDLLLLEGVESRSMPFLEFLQQVTNELQKSSDSFACLNIKAGAMQYNKTFHLKMLPVGFTLYAILERAGG